MKEIPLTQGKVALVDDADYHGLIQYTWTAIRRKRSWYAQASDGGEKILMHRLLMEFPDKEVDHKNGVGTDNRRDNLRLASRKQNNQNNQKHADGSSQYKGVSWSKERKRWLACIKIDRKTIYLGRYASEAEAAHAYNQAAQTAWGEFARLNPI